MSVGILRADDRMKKKKPVKDIGEVQLEEEFTIKTNQNGISAEWSPQVKSQRKHFTTMKFFVQRKTHNGLA